MRQLLTPHIARALVPGLVLSLLVAMFAPLLHVQEGAEKDTFSDWLRSHVPVEDDEQFDEALRAAEEQDAEHLTDFIKAFVEAHDAPDELAAILGDKTDGDLFSLLAGTSERLGASAVFPRFAVSGSNGPFTLDRLVTTPATFTEQFANSAESISSLEVEAGEMLVYAFRLFSNAQPLGP